MDGLSLFEASIFYSVVLLPLISIILVICWASLHMKNTAKAQLVGIFTFLVLGILTINSSLFLVIEGVAFILLVLWIVAYRHLFLKGQLRTIILIFALQIVYYILLYFFFVGERGLAMSILSIIPLISIILLYPWMFGNKKTLDNRVFIIIIGIIQVIFIISNLVLSLMIISN